MPSELDLPGMTSAPRPSAANSVTIHSGLFSATIMDPIARANVLRFQESAQTRDLVGHLRVDTLAAEAKQWLCSVVVAASEKIVATFILTSAMHCEAAGDAYDLPCHRSSHHRWRKIRPLPEYPQAVQAAASGSHL